MCAVKVVAHVPWVRCPRRVSSRASIAMNQATPTIQAAPSQRFGAAEWGLVGLLAAINFTHIVDFVIVMPLGDQLRHQLEIDPQQFGFIVSVYGIAAMIAGLAASAVVDRFDRKQVLLASFAGFLGATLYCGFAKDYAHLLVARAIAGLFGGVTAAGIMAIIADVFPPQQRGKAIGAVTSSFAVASTVGLPMGLWLTDAFDNFGAAFTAIAVFGLPVWAATWWKLPSLTAHRTDVRSNPLVQFAAVVSQPNHLFSFAFMLATVLATFIIVTYIAPYLQAKCGRTAGDLPIIYAVAGCASLVTMNVFGLLTDRIGPRPVFWFTAGGAVVGGIAPGYGGRPADLRGHRGRGVSRRAADALRRRGRGRHGLRRDSHWTVDAVARRAGAAGGAPERHRAGPAGAADHRRDAASDRVG
jgi:predicted MFS family arabinose efflux permease